MASLPILLLLGMSIYVVHTQVYPNYGVFFDKWHLIHLMTDTWEHRIVVKKLNQPFVLPVIHSFPYCDGRTEFLHKFRFECVIYNDTIAGYLAEAKLLKDDIMDIHTQIRTLLPLYAHEDYSYNARPQKRGIFNFIGQGLSR